MARLFFTLTSVDPFSESELKTREVGLEKRQIDVLTKNGDKLRLARLKLMEEVLSNPIAIFQDWKRPEHEDGLCYVGRPEIDYRAIDITVPAPPGMVFMIFVKESGKITDWRWEPADSENPDLPEKWQERFGKQIWPKKLQG